MGFQALVKLALKCFDSLAWPLFALGYPLYASIQAIEANSNTDTKKLVTYWIIFSLISLFEHAFTGILQWLPFWPYVKLTIVCWTMIPHFDGAFYLYNHFVHPCLYMDLPTIINWFKKAQDLFLKDNFLEVADDCVKTRGPTEVQEKLIANEPNGTEPSILQKGIKPVQITEKWEVAPILKTDPTVVQTVNNTTVTLSETVGEVGSDLPEIPSDKQVQKEWTCAMCQVTTTSEITLNSHLRGRNHKNNLMQAKNQPCKGNAGLASKVKQWEKGSKKHEPPKGQVSASSAAYSNAVNPKTETSKSNLPKEEWEKAIPTTNMVGNNVKSSEKVQGKQQQVGKEHGKTKIPQFRCTICNITCGRSEDLNSHLWGKKHLANIQKHEPPKGQVSASSAACSKAVNPKTETSESNLPKEEWKKAIPTTNMVGNHVKSSEKVQGKKQQVGKEHDKTKIPQFRCTICNITCGRSEDLNSHLWGKKHLANIQKHEPPKGQVSASSAACSKAVNPKTETSESNLPKEEWKKAIPTTNMVGNHVKSSAWVAATGWEGTW